jgi:flavin reductase (DIM6/NTAB) family NADH-FMN oxidoreductase RutF
MKEINWSKSLDLISPLSYILVTTISGTGKPNIIGIGWWTFANNKPLVFTVAIGNNRQSYKNLQEVGEFVACFPPEEQAKGAWLCGTKSGQRIDKFKETGFEMTSLDNIKPPMISGSVVAYACKVINQVKITDHTIFIGEILGIYTDSESNKRLYSIHYKKLVSLDMEGNSNFDLDYK